MNMMISGVTVDKEGNKKAYILFEDNGRALEASIPECSVIKNDGFTEDETSQMIDYMKANLTDLKKQAAKINPIKAIMK